MTFLRISFLRLRFNSQFLTLVFVMIKCDLMTTSVVWCSETITEIFFFNFHGKRCLHRWYEQIFFRKIYFLFDICKYIQCTLSKSILYHIDCNCLENCDSLSLLFLNFLVLSVSILFFSFYFFLFLLIFECIFIVFSFQLTERSVYFIKLLFEPFMYLLRVFLQSCSEKLLIFNHPIPFLDSNDTFNDYATISFIIKPQVCLTLVPFFVYIVQTFYNSTFFLFKQYLHLFSIFDVLLKLLDNYWCIEWLIRLLQGTLPDHSHSRF